MQDDPPGEDTGKASSRTFVTCGGCNKEVSDDTKTCPYCGKTLIVEWSWTLIVLNVVLLAVATILYYLAGNK